MIDADGHNLEVMSLQNALQLAKEQNLDLIEISPTAKPPVARIMDWGKFQYQQEKQERQAKQKKPQELKTIRFGLKIGKHDLEIRAQQSDKFLKAGNKVKIELRLKGREKQYQKLAQEKLNYFLTLISQSFKIEQEIKKQPQGLTMLITQL